MNLKESQTPHGATLNCKGWVQEAALRMLLNNLDPEVAERPEDLIVYGGRGKAARNKEALTLIIKALEHLEDDETLLIQSGKPVGVLPTHKDAPRVLISNSQLVPKWATQQHFDSNAAALVVQPKKFGTLDMDHEETQDSLVVEEFKELLVVWDSLGHKVMWDM